MSKSYRNLPPPPTTGALSASELPTRSVLLAIQDARGIGHNGGPALSDADLIREVFARGLQSAVATQLPVHDDRTVQLDELKLRTLRPLAVSVKTAAEMLGVGITTIWLLIKEQQLEVIRPVRRTLVTSASLETLVATLSARSRLQQQMSDAPTAEDRPPIQQEVNSRNPAGKPRARRPRSSPNASRAESDFESDK